MLMPPRGILQRFHLLAAGSASHPVTKHAQ